jgi:two-component system response regulator PhoP
MRVAVVEDERRLAENIAASLRETAGFAVDVAHDGEEGLYLATTYTYDAIVLDLMLPKISGAELLTKMRATGARTPVLILTAKDEVESILKLLDQGADDYMCKPFDLREVRARLNALIRRSHGHVTPILVVGDLELDANRAQVRRSGQLVTLTHMETKVLEYLMLRKGNVVSKSELLDHLYDFNWEKFSNVLEVYICGLRRKLDTSPATKLIHTVRGHGYVISDQVLL